jgi:uncharacterized protein (UPF0332 family)
MNRIYYAMFYATLAMLALRNLSSSKHSGAISLFHREFVKSGEFPPALAKRLDVAFDWRLAGDYKEFVSLKREDLIAFYDDAKSFLNQAEDVVSRALPSHISLHRGLNS